MITIPLLVGSAWALPSATATWTVLQDSDPRIECTTEQGKPWCRSTGIVEVPIDQVADTLEHMAEYQGLFDSITSIKVLAPDTLQVVLDYPFPLTDRDYVAKFTRTVDGDVRSYRWDPVIHPDAPETSAAVRLPNMAGEWKLEPAEHGTKVTYTWEAEVAGSLPEGGYNIARKTAGKEALKDIAKASLAAAKQKQG